ncbi:MAG: allantoinase AllB [Acidobacteriota bacterium]|nr:allantoinase AllB [Acidobacteriota bacterium]
MRSLIIRGERVVLPDGTRPASIHVTGGRIVDVGAYEDRPTGVDEITARDLVVLPGLVDTHVHINEPGRTDWEGFAHATRAAAAGGVTTLVDMPLNSIPSTTTVDGLEAKRRAARDQCHVDVGFWGGVVPGNAGQLEPLARAGVRGFKCFLSPSGVDEFAHVTETDLREALPILANLGLPLLVHAEMPALLRQPSGDPRCYVTWLESRPSHAEDKAIELLVELAREYRTPVHIVHLASADALPALRAARASGLSLTVETCPHYLTFASEDVRDGATLFKCAPPIRERAHRERLWQALMSGDIDFVATDHSPAPPSLKKIDEGNFVGAWGGIASLQVGLAAVWTGAVRRGAVVADIAKWFSQAPARLAGLSGKKGIIGRGADADLVFWEPDGESTIDPANLYHRHAVSPYAGMTVRGRVVNTILRGEVIFDGGECTGIPRGRFV